MRIPDKEEDDQDYVTLHRAIKRVIHENGPATASEIADKINELGLYSRKDGKPLPTDQVNTRVNRHPHMFVRENGLIHLNRENQILSVEASVGGYFGTSYVVNLDLQHMKATFIALEDGYTKNDQEFELDNVTIERFCSELDGIRFFEWKNQYIQAACDGTNWSVLIKTSCRLFVSTGSNAFPKNWGRFCRSIEKVVTAEFR